MKITNELGLPQAIVDAVANDDYSKGDATISITELEPPRMGALRELHEDEIIEDASDRIWSLFGQSIHSILERANRTAIAERRLSINIDGWIISGAMDVYEEEGILVDYKTTTVGTYNLSGPQEWELQLNCYAVLLRHHGYKVEKLKVVALLRDWRPGEARNAAQQGLNYPVQNIVSLDIPVWDPVQAMRYLQDRVRLHQEARIQLPECSPYDQWVRDERWAVMKVGGKRAISGGVCTTELQAKAMAQADKNLFVQHRPGTKTRCAYYCPVSKFCTQYQDSLKVVDESIIETA